MTEQSIEKDPWCSMIPGLHRSLSDPSTPQVLPVSPNGLDLQDSCAYWETLRYLFRAILGWKSVPAGLSWWYASGMRDMGEPWLMLVNSLWNREEQLDFFAAREWEADGMSGFSGDEENQPYVGRIRHWPSEQWWVDLKKRAELEQGYPVYGGGWNPLHLGHSDLVGLSDPSGSADGWWRQNERRAVLIVTGFSSWRTELRNFGNQLPPLAERSWHVEVFDRVVGYLGMYRQSRITGQWFMGKHSVHMSGNPQL